jgi:hypothetical protein
MVVFVIIISGCKNQEPTSSSPSKIGSAVPAIAPAPPPITCPPGSAIDNGACVTVVTAEKVDAVAAQASRLDDLATFLDKAAVMEAPIELLGGFRQLDAWKKIASMSDKFKIVDEIAAALDTGVKQIRSFKSTLGTSSAKLTDLKSQLNTLLQTPAVAQPLAQLQTDVASKLRSVMQPLEEQITSVTQTTLGPMIEKFSDMGDMVLGACAMSKSAGGDSLKKLCGQAKDVFGQASTFLGEFKGKPLALLGQVTGELQGKLTNLLDAESTKLLAEAQTRVNALLNIPPVASGSGATK